MWRRFVFVALLLLSLVPAAVIASPAMAAYDPLNQACQAGGGAASTSPACSDTTSTPVFGSNGIGTRIIKVIALISGIAAVILIIIGGIQFVTSGGDAQKTAAARQTIVYAVVGIIIVATSQAIIMFVISKVQ